ncbi:MgtC/SapB family protein [Microvirga lenta]|uniref:MgtC/SapB family protein n=1 Tax=Microvirga lenta TaxID=2881337 RepID=UPI001CFFB885|nr:MgtC/SapB family protein [Microvirga lenta]MCB5176799.1 MgtC/SapB family protein [Microvirga lenta]
MTEWFFAFHAEHRESFEMLLRLFVAMVSGMAIGLNRDLYGKPIGMRTLGLVSLSSALAVMAGSSYGHVHFEEDAVSRVIQGILTGIGFLGAGVIIRRQDGSDVQGLTTASTVWMAAALGVTAGVGAWFITIVGNGLALTLLVFGKPAERWLNSLFGGRHESAED